MKKYQVSFLIGIKKILEGILFFYIYIKWSNIDSNKLQRIFIGLLILYTTSMLIYILSQPYFQKDLYNFIIIIPYALSEMIALIMAIFTKQSWIVTVINFFFENFIFLFFFFRD